MSKLISASLRESATNVHHIIIVFLILFTAFTRIPGLDLDVTDHRYAVLPKLYHQINPDTDM